MLNIFCKPAILDNFAFTLAAKVELFPLIVIGALPSVSPSGVHIATVFKVPDPAGTPGISAPKTFTTLPEPSVPNM